MKVELAAAGIGEGLGADVPPVSLIVTEGTPVAIAVEGDEQPLLVSMLLGGRLKPETGAVLLEGRDDVEGLRNATALVDTPWVAEPSAGVALHNVVREELTFAGLPSSRAAVTRVLAEHRLAEYGPLPMRALPAADRIRLFSELAALRPGVSMIVVTSPERHGAAAADWYPSLAAIADRGVLVAVVTDVATTSALAALGARKLES